MSQPDPWVVDADAAQFQTQVVEPSRERPVLIVVWASWDAPSVAQAESLAKRAREGAGRFLLARVDADRAPELAGALGVRALPTVLAVAGGKLMPLFEGSLPEEELDRLLDKLAPGGPGEPADPLASAREHLAEGRAAEALAELEALCSSNDELPEALPLVHAEALLELGRGEEAESVFAAADEALRDSPEGRALAARLERAREGTSLAELEAAVAADPASFDARMELGRALVAEKRYADGFEQWLEALRLDPAGRGSEAKAALLEAFEVLGLEDPVANEYRFQLSLELFA